MPPQITRLILTTVVIVAVYSTARYLLTPPSFGQYGWFRGDALQEIASKAPVYAGKQACDECHSEILQKLAKDKHKTISCESCHGVCEQHARNPDVEITKLTGSHCLRCHEANPSRPAWMRQIIVKTHYTGQRCAGCHVPHQPNEVP